jgi:hypothetical protein
VLFAPGVGVDVDGVAVLGEAIDESDDAGRAGKASPQPNVGRGSAILVQQRKIMAISATTL